MAIRVFVYGSLLNGLGNHYILGNSTFLGRGVTDYPEYRMVSLGLFPGVIHTDRAQGETYCIEGELYEVTEAVLERLDYLEGHPDFYNRRLTSVYVPETEEVHTAWIYLLTEDYLDQYDEVRSGDWKDWLNGGRD